MNLSQLIEYLQNIYDCHGDVVISIQGYSTELSPDELFEMFQNYYTKDCHLDIRGDNLQLEYNRIIEKLLSK